MVRKNTFKKGKSAGTFIAVGVACVLRRAWWGGPLPLHHHRLLAARAGWVAATRPSRRYLLLQIMCWLPLRVARGILVDGSLLGGGQLSLAGSPPREDHHTFAGSTPRACGESARGRGGVAGLQTIGFVLYICLSSWSGSWSSAPRPSTGEAQTCSSPAAADSERGLHWSEVLSVWEDGSR